MAERRACFRNPVAYSGNLVRGITTTCVLSQPHTCYREHVCGIANTCVALQPRGAARQRCAMTRLSLLRGIQGHTLSTMPEDDIFNYCTSDSLRWYVVCIRPPLPFCPFSTFSSGFPIWFTCRSLWLLSATTLVLLATLAIAISTATATPDSREVLKNWC